MKLSLLIAFAVAFVSTSAFALPEYAVKVRANCTSCHVTPWGGGPRTVYGKIYGSRSLGNPSTNLSDVYFADMRALAYYPTASTSQNQNGTALMEAAISGDVPVHIGEDGSELRAVGTYNIAPTPFGGPREIYFRWKPNAGDTFLTVGRIVAPFGLLTDEHRTYARLETQSTYNTYDNGAVLSANPLSTVHVDIGMTNDLEGSGTFNSTGIGWGEVANVRWMPETLPLFVGASQNFQYSSIFPKPYAFSLYTAISLDRLTDGVLTGSILAEAVRAKNWNNPLINSGPMGLGFFIPSSDADYQTAVSQSQATAYYIQAKYDLNRQWTLFYKFDYLALTVDYPSDAFIRHGVGFWYYISSNMDFNMRVEKAFVGRPEIQGLSVLAAQNDVIGVLHFWF